MEHEIVVSSDYPLEFLIFSLGSEEYGIDVRKVQEVRGYDSVTSIANAPAFIKGVIKLPGQVVPIVDLRNWLDLGGPAHGRSTVVVIACVAEQVMGIVVDGVSDVVALEPAQVRPAPQTGVILDIDCLLGTAVVDDRTMILLDIDRLMRSREAVLANELAA
ncbi:chemotaxis protein CheW [Noviherbaspirillum agri]